MESGASNPIVIRQYFLFCLVFLFIASTTARNEYASHVKENDRFNWVEFESSLDDQLFCNVHRMDKNSFYQLLSDIMPALNRKHKRHNRVRLPYLCMLSMTLSFLGGLESAINAFCIVLFTNP